MSIDSEIDAEQGVGRIQNAFNVDDRCLAIEKLGDIFYGDPSDCEETKIMA